MAAYFNLTLFRRNLIRFWPLALACLIVAFFVFVVPEATSRRYMYWHHNYQKDIMSALAVYCAVFVPIMSIFTAIAVFGYLHNPRAAGFISSLPISRLGLYITNWLSGLALMLVPTLLIGFCYGLMLIGQPVPQGSYLMWLGALILSYLLFFSIAVFLTFLTGKPIMQAFLYVLVNFVCVALYGIGLFVAERMVYGFTSLNYAQFNAFVMWLTPPYAVGASISDLAPYGGFGVGEFSTVLFFVGYLVLTAVLVLSGYLLYRRRRIESADDVIVHKTIRSVFKYLIGFLLGVFLGFILTEITNMGWSLSLPAFTAWLTVSAVFFGSLGCLFAEMLIQKRLRVWKSAWKGILAYSAAVVALALFIRFDGTGYERRVPDSNDVAAVMVSTWYAHSDVLIYGGDEFTNRWGGRYWSLNWDLYEHRRALGLPVFTDEFIHEVKLRTPEYFESSDAIDAAILLHQSIIGDKSALEGNRRGRPNWTYYLTYKMNDGRIITREYPISFSVEPLLGSTGALIDLNNQHEPVSKRNRFLTLPDNALLGAAVSPPYDQYYYDYQYYSSMRMPLTRPAITSSGDLMFLMDAMRRDAAAGAIGYVSLNDFLESYGWYYEPIPTDSRVVELIYDPVAARIPPIFANDFIRDLVPLEELPEFEESASISGFRLSVRVSEQSVNTLWALSELGYLE